MNEENHAACLQLETDGCKSIQVFESCPLQFVCDDEPYNHCVTLFVYKDSTCSGKALREISFPTMEQEGSPCYSDASMAWYSVKDQYCSDASFHQTVYIGSTTCEVPWYHRLWSPQKQVYTKDSCSYGFKLKSCQQGPCVTDDAVEAKEEEVTTAAQQ
jgi:hypothetical protein